jgi:uncharacterized membrane protein
MPGLAQGYIANDVRMGWRSQAIRVWIGLVSVAAIWVLLIVSAPLLAANSNETIAQPIYNFFSYICHQKPERSLHIADFPFAVCSRCFGVYLGMLLGLIVYPLWRRIDDIEPLPRFWLFLSLIPIGIDWLLGVTGIWENNHATRLITGMILGFTCATYIVPAVVEIVRNLRKPAR